MDFLFGGHHTVDRATVWTAIAAIAAMAAIVVAYVELNSVRKTTRADFAKRFIDSFFTPETRTLFTLLENSALEFRVLIIKDDNGNEVERLPYLEIKRKIVDQMKGIVQIDEERKGYSAFEIDDLLLGHCEDVGWYEKRGLIDFETVEQTFGEYIRACRENESITKYLADKDTEGKYEYFRYIYNRVKNG
jgi:hypothetical protein